MDSYTFCHEGKPKVKERPRSGKHGGKLYTPKATLDAQAQLASSYHGPMFDGPISVLINLYADRTVVTIADWFGSTSPLRGDIDNYEKLVLDGLEGVAYPNDRQVHQLWTTKA